ncbi:O-methylsterigmatocystin oxidoreductase [Leucoagaricus sp. SymC.cos]|nr:O-methylsterigmatocystin oxidoreductase [Leucoagaricus sp. SymC.cos]
MQTNGTAGASIATSLIQGLPGDGSSTHTEADLLSRNICAIALAGGSDTTVSTVQTFFMAMVIYPDIQKKAQAELDQVSGGRLPEFSDRPNLPYINALVKESLRWQPIAPLAAAHMASEADYYNGYYIPKGTAVIGNAWTILSDSEIYSDPTSFNPDRFLKDGKLDPSVRDPTVACFGFGRRICPGRFFALDSIFMTFAHVLSVFNVLPPLDEGGKEIRIKPEWTNGFIT